MGGEVERVRKGGEFFEEGVLVVDEGERPFLRSDWAEQFLHLANLIVIFKYYYLTNILLIIYYQSPPEINKNGGMAVPNSRK